MNTQRQSLSLDLDSLFPGETLTIGNVSILIRPLGLEQIAVLTKKIESAGEILSKEGVTWENYSEKTSIFKISKIIIEQFPDVLSEAANVEIEDLKKLPLECIMLIVDKVLEVNMKSKDNLSKNFKSLVGKFQTIATLEDEKKRTPIQRKTR